MSSGGSIQFNSAICGLKASQIASQSKINYQKITKSAKCDGKTQKYFITEKIPKPSGSIIFFKQHYEQLFYQKSSVFPNIKSICFKFFNQRQHSRVKCLLHHHESSVQITIHGNKSQKEESIVDIVVWKQGDVSSNKHIHLGYKLIPNDKKDPTLVAKTLLQKKFWIKLSSDLDQVSVNINDYSHLIDNGSVQNENALQKPLLSLGLDKHDSWQSQENSFSLKSNENSKDYKKIALYDLDSIKVTYQFQVPQGSTDKQCLQLIKDCHTVKMIQINRILNPILSQNPSILGKDGNQELLSQQIRVLYEYLRTLSINQLPKYSTKDKQFDMDGYTNWRSFKTAIDQSIKTKPGYLLIKRQDSVEKQPIGIMNALMMVKSIDISKDNLNNPEPDLSKVFRWTQFNWKNSKSIGQLINQIYEKRQMYIRLELLDHEGIGPGSMAVLQVWPPYCCSPIHNHGQSFGLIKVLTNQICVQNYNDLSFSPLDLKPYQSNIYKQGQFTWLSQYSYGIHRLVNPTSHTTLSLQAYMGDKGTKEYFEFIEYEKDHQKYIEYYPQNDWRNFLNWPSIIGDSWKNVAQIQDLIKYIEEVKKFYKINDKSREDFPHLVEVLRKQSEIYERLTNEQSSNPGKKIYAQFEPFEKILNGDKIES